MKFNYFISILVIAGFVFVSIISSPGCASIIPPTGGPKDSLPPILTKADPPDSSKSFKSKTINFTFDEYIKLQSVQENLVISPTPKFYPEINSKLKTVTVKIKDTLEENTTYVYNFGKSIIDENEGNVLKDFKYIFSTGNYLDSLELKGKVLLAETGVADSTLTVMLHKSGVDSALINDKPRYISKLDSLGNFRFSFLPTGTYYLYAIKGEGGVYSYFRTEQLFAFADDPVEIKPGINPITLYAFAEKKAASASAASSANRIQSGKAEDRRLRYTTSASSNPQDLLIPFTMNFEQAIAKFDSSKLQLSTDSTFVPEKNYSFQLDSLQKKITMNIKWKEGTRYNLILDKSFAEDSAGRKLLKTDTLKFSTKKLKEYGSVKLNFSNLDTSLRPVLFFMISGGVFKSFPITNTVFFESLFNPGEYEIKILFDKNKNGKWDAGDFWNGKKQPELVKPISKKITIKAEWENEYELAIPDHR